MVNARIMRKWFDKLSYSTADLHNHSWQAKCVWQQSAHAGDSAFSYLDLWHLSQLSWTYSFTLVYDTVLLSGIGHAFSGLNHWPLWLGLQGNALFSHLMSLPMLAMSVWPWQPNRLHGYVLTTRRRTVLFLEQLKMVGSGRNISSTCFRNY